MEKSSDNNEFKNDDPLDEIANDKLGYSFIVKRLSSVLVKENHLNSFSIGLVGPFGNGKSSIINLLIDKLKDRAYLKTLKKNDKPIVVHFLPYLNHKEDDIINEFFMALSNKLSLYNGKLSDQILEYSNKLTDLYHNKNLSGLFDKHISRISDQPAKLIYDDINCRLKEIDEKIIVFVDDLDRLNDNEIMQVLKLIRNTANFYNTTFVVALDKQYVLNRLSKENKILNSNFIDKFFQLEVFLPEIEQTVLRNYVLEELIESLKVWDQTFKIKLTNALKDSDNLFDYYVKNFRDSKRFINQIIYDYKNFGEEIDLKDFMNFTYFKLKFPKFIKLLNDNRLLYLNEDTTNGIYKLKSSNQKNKSEGENKFMIFNTKEEDISQYRKYDIFEKILTDDECFKNIINVDCEDRFLLMKTLAYLFGDENIVGSFSSIRKVNNFRMLMQQRIFEDLLTEREFNNLFLESEIDGINVLIDVIQNDNKIDQLLNRFEYFNTDNQTNIERAINIALILFERKEDLGLNEHSLLKLLVNLMDINIKLNHPSYEVTVIPWIKKNIFESSFISTVNKIKIINFVWKLKHGNQRWPLDEIYIIEQSKSIFDSYIEEIKDLWDIRNFNFFSVFHDLKVIPGLKEYMAKKIKSFWNDKNIELFCAQVLNFAPFSFISFKISDFVDEVFNDKESFYQYVKNHVYRDDEAVKEFIEFFSLCKATMFKPFLKFKFEKSSLASQRILVAKEFYKGDSGIEDEYVNVTQVIFETNSLELVKNMQQNNQLNPEFSFEIFSDKKNHLWFFLLNVDTRTAKSKIKDFVNLIMSIEMKPFNNAQIELNLDVLFDFKNFLANNEWDINMKIISIQPNLE